jgi:hypothetical protein
LKWAGCIASFLSYSQARGNIAKPTVKWHSNEPCEIKELGGFDRRVSTSMGAQVTRWEWTWRVMKKMAWHVPSGSSTCPRPGEGVDRRVREVPRKSPDGTRKRQPDPAHGTVTQCGSASTDRARRETCRGASQRTTKARTPPAERGHGWPRAEPSASDSRRMVIADTSRATRTGDAHEF